MNEVELEAANAILTVGHSTRTLEVFINLLQGNSVQKVVDIRTIPHSRHNLQFDRARAARSKAIYNK